MYSLHTYPSDVSNQTSMRSGISRYSLSNVCIRRTSSSSVAKSAKTQVLSSQSLLLQISALWRQQTICTLLLCVLLLTPEFSGGEPQTFQGNGGESLTTKLGVLPPESLSTTHFLQSIPENREPSRKSVDDRVSDGRDDGVTIFHRPMISTVGPHFMTTPKSHNNQSNLMLSSVIASSFRNIDNNQLTTTNSNEETNSMGTAGGQRKRKGHKCDTGIMAKCFEGMPPMNDTGIPSTPKAVSTACRMYDVGMNCIDSWAKICLPKSHRQKVKESINGAHEMFSFLCKDPKFRADYLKHTDCYRKLSTSYDSCSRQFIDGLRRNTKHNYTAFCCIRLEFLRCVSKSSSFFCSLNATQFLMKMAETLVRSRVRPHSSDYCMHIHQKQCVPIVESGSLPSLTQQALPAWFFVTYVSATFFSQLTLG